MWTFKEVLLYAFHHEIKKQLGVTFPIEALACVKVKDNWNYQRNEERRCIYDLYSIALQDYFRLRIYLHPGDVTQIGVIQLAQEQYLSKDELKPLYTVDAQFNLKIYHLGLHEIQHRCPEVGDKLSIDIETLRVLLQEIDDP